MIIKQKLVASGLHFLVSLGVFSAFLFLLLYAWYPEPYFTASGGLQGLKIVILVDLVLGPLLTFVAFNKSKPKAVLTRDLVTIVTIQMGALFWGIYAVSGQRPVAIVFYENSFFTVPKDALSKHYAEYPLYQDLIKNPRQLIYSEKPVTVEGIDEMRERIDTYDLPPHHHIEYYRGFKDFFPNAKQYSSDIDEITRTNKSMKKQLAEILQKQKAPKEAFIYLPLRSRYRNIILVFDADGNTIGYLQAPYL